MKDLLNKTFGKLKVIEHLGKLAPGKKNRHRWKCICECGKTTIIQSNHLLSGDTRSCGCLNLRCGNKSPLFEGYGEMPLPFYNKIKAGCKRPSRQIEFDLSIEYIWDLFLKQNRKCALSGVYLEWGGSHHDNKFSKTSKITASLDRIDSTKGYVIGNVQWIHKDLNFMKQDLDEQRFIKWCGLVAKHRSENLTSTQKMV